MEVVWHDGDRAALRDDQLPGLDVDGLGEDGEVEGEAGQPGDGVRDVEGERIGALEIKALLFCANELAFVAEYA